MNSRRLLFPLVALAVLPIAAAPVVSPPPKGAEPADGIPLAQLKAHVARLASPEFLGRKGPGAARAAQYIADEFKALQIQPLFGDSYFQAIPWLLADDRQRADQAIGRNVGAILPGSDPQLREEWVLLSAHYDHLGTDGQRYYPGADDNGSGVAMLIEVARSFAQGKTKLKRTIVFVAFDLEESGLQGSTHFATKPPRDFTKLKAFITADMIGRSMANLMDEYVFCLGSESSPQLRQLVEEVKPGGGLKVGRLGADLVGTRSDYGPFRDRRVPFLFFSTGQHPDYHKTTDLPERLDYAKLRTISLWIAEVTRRLADDATAPVWTDNPVRLDLDEARTVLELVARALDRKTYPLTAEQRDLVTGVRSRLAGIVERGNITAAERGWLVWTARMLLLTVF